MIGIKIIQIGKFYIRFDANFKMNSQSERLVGLLSTEGYYSMCTDNTLTDCKTFRFQEFKLGLFFIGLAFGIESQFSVLGDEEITKIKNLLNQNDEQ